MKNILVVGSINMDMVIEAPKLPLIGESIIGGGFKTAQGGKGANQAVAAAKLGGNVRIIGCVGSDSNGDALIKSLSSFGVDTSCIMRSDKAPSGVAVITVCGGNNCIVVDEGANALIDRQLIDDNIASFEWADIVLLQLEMPVETVCYAAKLAKQNGAIVLLNPAPFKKFDVKMLDYVDIFVPNSIEAGQFLGTAEVTLSTAEKAMDEIRKYGTELVIITLGADGCVYNSGNDVIHKKAGDFKAVDTTAAGDSFIGGFCVSLCVGKGVPDAVDYATVVAGITVSRAGASMSIPTGDEVKKYLSGE